MCHGFHSYVTNYQRVYVYIYIYICIYIWVNYNISQTWNKAIWGWFPLWTMIPSEVAVRSWSNLPRYIYIYIYPYLRRPPGPPVVELFKNSHLRHQALQLDGWPRRNDRGDGNMTRIPWDDDKVITAVYVYIYNFVYDYIYIYVYVYYIQFCI